MNQRWRTLLAVDHDPKAIEVYRVNVPCDRVVCADVRAVLNDLPYADVILGGPPCQPFSRAGNRDGEHDPRNGVNHESSCCVRVQRQSTRRISRLGA